MKTKYTEGTHEDLRRTQEIEGSSDRGFGLVFTVVFVIIACWPLIHGESPRWWSFGVAGVLAAIAVFRPTVLACPNALWTKFGVFLGNVVGPIAVGMLFYGVVTPLGVVMRLTGKDPLRLKLDRGADSYWVLREPPGPPPKSMKNQF